MKSLTALSLIAALAGCSTIEGFGRDLAAGGEAIEEAAVEAQRPAPQPRPVYRQPVQQQPVYRNPPQQQPYSQPPPGSQYVY